MADDFQESSRPPRLHRGGRVLALRWSRRGVTNAPRREGRASSRPRPRHAPFERGSVRFCVRLRSWSVSRLRLVLCDLGIVQHTKHLIVINTVFVVMPFVPRLEITSGIEFHAPTLLRRARTTRLTKLETSRRFLNSWAEPVGTGATHFAGGFSDKSKSTEDGQYGVVGDARLLRKVVKREEERAREDPHYPVSRHLHATSTGKSLRAPPLICGATSCRWPPSRASGPSPSQ